MSRSDKTIDWTYAGGLNPSKNWKHTLRGRDKQDAGDRTTFSKLRGQHLGSDRLYPET